MSVKKCGVVLVLLAVLAGAAAASAGAASVSSTKKNDNSLMFTPVDPSNLNNKVFSDGQFVILAGPYWISQGQTNWHSKYIPPGYPGFYLDLNWGNSSNSLRLKVYGADGRIYGPFYDNSDGRIDGRILFWVTSGSGTVPSGNYYYEVYGDKIIGSAEDYTI